MPYKNKEDQKKYNEQWNKDHPNRGKQYYKDHPEKVKQANNRWRKNNPIKSKQIRKRAVLKRLYNLSYENWLEMWEDQNGKCAICRKTFIKPSDAHVDHNHKIDEVRGLLCGKCNRGIGHFNDNLELFGKIIKYLGGNYERIRSVYEMWM